MTQEKYEQAVDLRSKIYDHKEMANALVKELTTPPKDIIQNDGGYHWRLFAAAGIDDEIRIECNQVLFAIMQRRADELMREAHEYEKQFSKL